MWDEITYQFPNFNGTTVELGNGWVISSHTLLVMRLLFHVGITVIPNVCKMGPWAEWIKCYVCCMRVIEYQYTKISSLLLLYENHMLNVVETPCIKLDTVWVSPRSGMGVTKAPFVNFSVSKIFDLAKVPVILFASHSYLTGVTAAELRQHLSNMNMIFNR